MTVGVTHSLLPADDKQVLDKTDVGLGVWLPLCTLNLIIAYAKEHIQNRRLLSSRQGQTLQQQLVSDICKLICYNTANLSCQF